VGLPEGPRARLDPATGVRAVPHPDCPADGRPPVPPVQPGAPRRDRARCGERPP
jgi:hypothetical protein